MRNIINALTLMSVLASAQLQAQKNYVSLAGKIANKNSDSLMVISSSYRKKILVGQDGTFSDTLKVEAGSYLLYDGKEQKDVYLKNGFDLKVMVDCKEFDETILYSGKGSEVNNYLAQLTLLDEKELEDQTMFDLNKPDFEKKVKSIIEKYIALLKNTKNLDAGFREQQSKQKERLAKYLNSTYDEKLYMKTVLAKGNASPKFTNYENYKGGSTSLEDLKGKYVYIDLWATWCGPCKAEIPYLKEIEKRYHDKNIEFVSISVDDQKDHEKWITMVKELELGGIQLFADKNFESDFVKKYKVNAIPRFILLDPQGNIVSGHAPRPSEEKLTALFDELKI